ncbi:hypothetical protein IE81DRAFT_187028 [Ceraceosorus guamensis]|uniref:Zn(2)-C6 fungal-type domain-containing protein n=1 Tax=Ceraceosorus guamensis TaxID=1522189 RepID=A0A316VV61_9BASI|nr:hypothetical protein IE81DRAFT_187028 [Ceraceosorus guamensis]PWN41164.1 hypothetical protein IE81DRAFT_187028 [Ceraceosorus guamensis]
MCTLRSCSRCRQKKLRCDFQTPCSNCIGKGLESECHKDVRIPRGRKRPKAESQLTDEEEIVKLRKRLAELEERAVGGRLTPSNSSANSLGGRVSTRSDKSLRHRHHATGPADDRSGGNSSPGSRSHLSSSFVTATRDIIGSQEGLSIHLPLSGSASSDSFRSVPHGSTVPSPHSASANGSVLIKPQTHTRSSKPLILSPLLPAERALRSLETVANPSAARTIGGTSERDGLLKRLTGLSDDAPNAYWSNPSSAEERIALFVEARAAIPDPIVVEELARTFLYRANHCGGHVVYTPWHKAATELLSIASPEQALSAPIFQDVSNLGLWFLILSVGYHFHPNNGPTSHTRGFAAVHALRKSGIDPSVRWYGIAKRALAIEKDYVLRSLPALQCASLFLLLGRDDPAWLRMLRAMAIAGARDMGLPRLGSASYTHEMTTNDFVRLETAVRVWNFLCVRDWCWSQRDGSYSLHPSQMTTRLPLNLNDADLEAGTTESKSSSNWTEMSFVIAQVGLAHCVRDAADLRNANLGDTPRAVVECIDESFRRFLSAGLPHFYSVNSREATPPIMAPQRWMLHQQVFHQLLLVHRNHIASPVGRSTCLSLALGTLELFKQLRMICPIIEGMYVNSQHLFAAGTLLLLDLFNDNVDDEHRANVRDKVSAAVQYMSPAPRAKQLLSTLLDEEAQYYEATRDRKAYMQRDRTLDLATLCDRVAEVIEQTPGLPRDDVNAIDDVRMPDHHLMPALIGLQSPTSDFNQTKPNLEHHLSHDKVGPSSAFEDPRFFGSDQRQGNTSASSSSRPNTGLMPRRGTVLSPALPSPAELARRAPRILAEGAITLPSIGMDHSLSSNQHNSFNIHPSFRSAVYDQPSSSSSHNDDNAMGPIPTGGFDVFAPNNVHSVSENDQAIWNWLLSAGLPDMQTAF